ncbi:MAG: response regulator transcription factor [Pedobacter sp.]|nr:MAG: response regulator transcription factor [Pedobacter sp.]
MNIVIIEDEELTAQDLALTITESEPSAEIVAILPSVKVSLDYFATHTEKIDLIFSDIQLGDGTSFEIFEKLSLQVPIIFCTAYDEFALKAFDTNGIDYIMKPVDEKLVSKALKKYKKLTGAGQQDQAKVLHEIIALVKKEDPGANRSILVYHKDRIIPIPTSAIAFFHVKNSVTHITTFEKKTYLISKSLDELEKMSGPAFFRANRQFLVNRQAVVQASNSFSRKLTVELNIPSDEQVLVSKEKIPQFLNWLSEGNANQRTHPRS